MRIALINMSNNASFCPRGLSMTETPKRLCGKPTTALGCSSAFFDVHDINYTKVCGRVKGYQYHTPEAFFAYASGVGTRYGRELKNTIIIVG